VPRARREITIGRPLSEVFAFVADGENDPKWRSAVLDVKRTSGAAPGKGARYRQGVKGPFGRRVAADYEVTDFEADRTLGFRVTEGPVRPKGRYTVEPDGSGTKLTFELSCELTGPKKLLMSGPVQKSMDGEMKNLDELKRILE
jgi:uncharacterized protein YndB with AHSA1/START domain